jgi:hypothetical protein
MTRPMRRRGLRMGFPSPTLQKLEIVVRVSVTSPAPAKAWRRRVAENMWTWVGSRWKLQRRPRMGRARLPALRVMTTSLPPGTRVRRQLARVSG